MNANVEWLRGAAERTGDYATKAAYLVCAAEIERLDATANTLAKQYVDMKSYADAADIKIERLEHEVKCLKAFIKTTEVG